MTFTWEDLPVGAAFHTHHMEQGRLAMMESIQEINFTLDEKALLLPVYLCDGENKLEGDVVAGLLKSQFVDPVRW